MLLFLQVQIMKMLEHPNIVNLIEVINDPETDHFYIGMYIVFPFFLVLKGIWTIHLIMHP